MRRTSSAWRRLCRAFVAPSRTAEGFDAAVDELRQRAEARLGMKTKGATREYTESLVVAVLIALFLRAFVVEAFKIPTGSMIPTLQVGDHIFVNKFIYGLRVPLSNRWFVEWGDPGRGDIIVFRYPRNQAQDFIKRVVAVPGDRIRVEGRDVYVNGEPLPRIEADPVQYLEEGEGSSMLGVRRADAYLERPSAADVEYTVLYQDEDDVYRQDWPIGIELPGLKCDPAGAPEPRRCTVKDGYFFVMGDNRDNSADSREWGGVPRELVKGRAMFVWFSYGPRSGIRWSRFGRGVH
jgi:signal peptidase I